LVLKIWGERQISRVFENLKPLSQIPNRFREEMNEGRGAEEKNCPMIRDGVGLQKEKVNLADHKGKN